MRRSAGPSPGQRYQVVIVGYEPETNEVRFQCDFKTCVEHSSEIIRILTAVGCSPYKCIMVGASVLIDVHGNPYDLRPNRRCMTAYRSIINSGHKPQPATDVANTDTREKIHDEKEQTMAKEAARIADELQALKIEREALRQKEEKLTEEAARLEHERSALYRAAPEKTADAVQPALVMPPPSPSPITSPPPTTTLARAPPQLTTNAVNSAPVVLQQSAFIPPQSPAAVARPRGYYLEAKTFVCRESRISLQLHLNRNGSLRFVIHGHGGEPMILDKTEMQSLLLAIREHAAYDRCAPLRRRQGAQHTIAVGHILTQLRYNRYGPFIRISQPTFPRFAYLSTTCVDDFVAFTEELIDRYGSQSSDQGVVANVANSAPFSVQQPSLPPPVLSTSAEHQRQSSDQGVVANAANSTPFSVQQPSLPPPALSTSLEHQSQLSGQGAVSRLENSSPFPVQPPSMPPSPDLEHQWCVDCDSREPSPVKDAVKNGEETTIKLALPIQPMEAPDMDGVLEPPEGATHYIPAVARNAVQAWRESFGEKIIATSMSDKPSPEELEMLHAMAAMHEQQLSLSHLHRSSYPFVVYGFVASGLSDVPPGWVSCFTHRLGTVLVKKAQLVCDNGTEQHFLRLLIDAPGRAALMETIPRPEHFKSVKTVKSTEVIMKGCALIGVVHPENEDEDTSWIGWNDFAGILRFEYNCSRVLKLKYQSWHPSFMFVMFGAKKVKKGWMVTELTYSDIKIVEREGQWPCEVFFIPGLVIKDLKNTTVFEHPTIRTPTGEPLVVYASKENVEYNRAKGSGVYGAIVGPDYTDCEGAEVKFRAIGVLPMHQWETVPYLNELARGLFSYHMDREKFYTFPTLSRFRPPMKPSHEVQ